MAQGLIPPSRQYVTPKREPLDKTYGLPTFGTPGESMPKQRTTAPDQQPQLQPQQADRPDPFKPMPSFAQPATPPQDSTPDFFQKPSGLASTEASSVPNFFQDSPDAARPRARTPRDGDTPLFTTDQGTTTGDTPIARVRPGDTPTVGAGAGNAPTVAGRAGDTPDN